MTPAVGGFGPSLRGAARLIAGDPGGMDLLDTTPAGAARSFVAALITAPIWLAILAVQERFALAQLPASALTYVIAWTAFPVAMSYLVRLIDRPGHLPRYLTATNWAAVFTVPVIAAPALLHRSGLLPLDAAEFLSLTTLLFVLVIEVRILRAALEVRNATAIPLAILAFLTSLLVEYLSFVVTG